MRFGISVPLLAAVFLLSQLMFGFHLHADDDHHQDPHDAPGVECTLCLAAARVPLGLAEPPSVMEPEPVELASLLTPPPLGITAYAAQRHPPRAPPTTLD